MGWDIDENQLQKMSGVRNVQDSREGCQISSSNSLGKQGDSPDKREPETKWRHPQKGRGGKKNDPEGQAQREFFHLVRSLEPIYPVLQMVRSDQAGMRTHPNQANKAKAGGMRRGFPDIDVPLARKGYGGLHIELKAGKNRPTQDQQWWLDRLREQGRMAVVCHSAHDAWNVLAEYLGIEQ